MVCRAVGPVNMFYLAHRVSHKILNYVLTFSYKSPDLQHLLKIE